MTEGTEGFLSAFKVCGGSVGQARTNEQPAPAAGWFN
ncbi:MAG: phage protease [Chloroflexi bacterium]|nr:phage protease [Chloroflexota bacterium]